MQKLRQNKALVDTLTHTDILVYIFVERGQVACLKQPREKRTSDMCGIIKKHELLLDGLKIDVVCFFVFFLARIPFIREF